MADPIRYIQPAELAPPRGHFSHGAAWGGLVFVSGQLAPLGPDGRASGDFETQVREALEQLLAVVRAAGGTAASLVKVNAYIVGVERWARFNAVYAEVLGDARPARAVIPVPELHDGRLVEIEAVAVCEPPG